MIVLDTNVVSGVIGDVPDPEAIDWLDRQNPDEVFTTAITAAELLSGVALMAHGRRRSLLGDRTARFLNDTMEGRVLPFTTASALEYGDVLRLRRRLGQPIESFDAQIAAIARAHSAVVATRNVRDFVHTGVEIDNPWGR